MQLGNKMKNSFSDLGLDLNQTNHYIDLAISPNLSVSSSTVNFTEYYSILRAQTIQNGLFKEIN